MTMPGGASAAPDWYPDPSAPNQLRYWDGTQWTGHVAPASARGYAPAAAPRKAMSGGVVAAIIIGAFVLFFGVLAAIAVPVYTEQKAKAADASAKADVVTLGRWIATWYADTTEVPEVLERDGAYYVGGTKVANAYTGVEFGGFDSTGPDDWCVWVTNPDGNFQDYEYSSRSGMERGTCD